MSYPLILTYRRRFMTRKLLVSHECHNSFQNLQNFYAAFLFFKKKAVALNEY